MIDQLKLGQDYLPEISEDEIRRHIESARGFLAQHPDLLDFPYYRDTPAYQNEQGDFATARHLRAKLNTSAKVLLARGGKVPQLLNGITSLIEKLDLILTGENGGLGFKIVHVGTSGLEDRNAEDGLQLQGFISARGITRRQRLRLPGGDPSIKSPLGIGTLHGVTDALLVLIRTRDQVGRDLGWVMPGYTGGEFHRLQVDGLRSSHKRAQGLLWRVSQLSEVIHASAEQLPKASNLSRLAIIGDTSGKEGTRAKTPAFNDGAISFGPQALGTQITREEAAKRTPGIRDGVQASSDWIRDLVYHELQRDPNDNLRGGREDLHPERLLNS